MRIVKEESEDPHSNLKSLSENAETTSSSDEDDVESLLDDIHIID